MRTNNLKVCYVLSYRSPNYIRTITIVRALQGIPGVSLFQARNKLKGIFRYIETLYKLIGIRLRHNPDIYILGFRGHEIFWLVRLITIGKPLIFDEMMSPYDSLKNERKGGLIGKLISPFVYMLEKSIFMFSNLIITDTQAHKEHFAQIFKTKSEKIDYVYVSSDENTFKPIPAEDQNAKDSDFNVFFYSSFQPLHGVNIIAKAAKLLEDLPIKFNIVGGKGKRRKEFLKLIRTNNIDNINYLEWVDYEKLPEMIAQSDLCLGGPFGDTSQGKRVITGKTFQFLSMGKATIIGNTSQDNLFMDMKNALICKQGSPESLAEKIRWAYNNPDKLQSIGDNAKKLYDEKFSNEQLIIQLENILNKLEKHEK